MADGKGCKCAAYSSSDCGCPDVDWTPQEVYDLRAKCAEKDALLQEAARLLEDVVMKEGWIRADKLARRIRESLGGWNG